MANYLFEARLRAPLIADLPGLHLDSLLAAAVCLQDGSIRDAAGEKTGVRSTVVSGFKLYHASSCHIPPNTSSQLVTVVRNRTSAEVGPEFYAGKKVRNTKNSQAQHPWWFNRGSGDFKNIINTYRALQPGRCYWLAETEEPDRILELLDSLGGLGKRSRQGYGEIAGLSYSELPADTSAVLTEKGYPRRVLPAEVYAALLQDAGLSAPADVQPTMMRNYAISGWENPLRKCVCPPNVDLDPVALLGDVDETGEIFFG